MQDENVIYYRVYRGAVFITQSLDYQTANNIAKQRRGRVVEWNAASNIEKEMNNAPMGVKS